MHKRNRNRNPESACIMLLYQKGKPLSNSVKSVTPALEAQRPPRRRRHQPHPTALLLRPTDREGEREREREKAVRHSEAKLTADESWSN